MKQKCTSSNTRVWLITESVRVERWRGHGGGVLMFHPVKPRGTMMKMAPVSLITLFVLCCSRIASTDAQDVCDKYAPTGGDFDVPINIKLEATHSLKWFRNDSTIFYKRGTNIIGQTVYTVDPKGFLKLTKLKRSDSGKYTFDVHDSNGQALTKGNNIVRLCVLDPVKKPIVEMKCLPDSKVQFTCKVQGTAHTTLQWFHDKKTLLEKVLTLTKPAKDLPNDVTCKVSNDAGSETSDPVKHTCNSVLDMKVLGYSIWIFVGAGAGIVVLLIIIVIICCVQTRRKKQLRLKEEGEMRLQWSRTETHTHTHPEYDNHNHHHHHHSNQQPAGHTGPRQNRSKQQRNQQRGRLPEPPTEQPQPSPRRPPQALPVDNADEEDPPPLPQPRKKGPKTRV